MKLEHDVNNIATRGEGAARSRLRPSGQIARVVAFVGCVVGRGGALGVSCADTGSDGAGGGPGATARPAEAVGAANQALTAPPVCIAIQRGLSGTVADAIVANKTPYANFGASGALLTGLVSATQRESLLRFDLPAIPAGATINSVILTLYKTATMGSVSDIKVHRATAAWNENTVTWGTFNQAFNPAVEGVINNSANPWSPPGLIPLVQSWVSGAQANYGMLLEQPFFGTNVTQFLSSDGATVAQRRRLDVCYTVTCAAGFADCNGIGTDGCETAITTTSSSTSPARAAAMGTRRRST